MGLGKWSSNVYSIPQVDTYHISVINNEIAINAHLGKIKPNFSGKWKQDDISPETSK